MMDVTYLSMASFIDWPLGGYGKAFLLEAGSADGEGLGIAGCEILETFA